MAASATMVLIIIILDRINSIPARQGLITTALLKIIDKMQCWINTIKLSPFTYEILRFSK